MIKTPIYLMGFMASGKSSLAKKLANRLALACIDLDDWIAKREGKDITEIFQQEGEAYFRKVEQQALLEVSTKEAVVALGGGTPCFYNNMQIIKASGTSVYLNVPQEVLIGRLKQNRVKRPLIARLEEMEINAFVHSKLEERAPFYLQADYIINKPKVSPIELIELLT